MADIDLKTETPDASINDSAILFGADSQASANPSVYSVATVRSHFVGAGTLNVASGKTLTASNTLTLAGTDGTTMTFPTTSATLARTDAGNTFTGNQTLGSSDNLNWNSDTILTRRGAANLRLGAADAAAPVAQTLSVQSVVAGTSNTAGANLTITGSQGTGTGAGGSIIFQVAPAGSSGTAQNAFQTVLQITGAGGLTGQDGATANTLALRNGTNAQTFRVYNTTDGTNSSYASISFFSNDLYIVNEKTGTGASGRIIIRSLGALRLGANSSANWEFTTSNHLTCLADNTHDIGASGASRPRSIFVGTSIRTPQINNNAGTIGIEGTTSSFPALKRSSTTLQVRLADDTANAPLESASVKTDAPAGGTSGTWKLGVAATVSPTSPNRTIEVDIGGTIYYIAAKTTND